MKIRVKRGFAVLLCLVPLAAYAAPTYTNEDLGKVVIPVAYTNEDLKRLPPVPVVGLTGPIGAPAATAPAGESQVSNSGPFQLKFQLMVEHRLTLQSELDWRREMVRKSYSYVNQGPQGGPWLGYKSKSKDSIRALEMRISVIDQRIEDLRDQARRAGVRLSER